MATKTVAKDALATMEDYAAADFEALLSGEQAKEFESIAQSFSAIRRVGFATLSRSKAQLVDGVESEESAEALLEMSQSIDNYAKHLKDQVEMMGIASMRILSTLATVAQRHNIEAGDHGR